MTKAGVFGASRGMELLKRHAPGAVAFLLPMTVYLTTLCPTVYTMDSAELTLAAYYLGLIHAPGHPLFLLLGRLFTLLPFGDIAYRVNLLSAFCAACTVYLLYRLERSLGVRPLFALSASLLFAFSRSVWSVANVAEVYALHTAIVTGLFLLLLRWQETQRAGLLGWLAFGYGLSHASHTSSVLLAPSFFYGLRTAWGRLFKPRQFVPLVLLFLLGLSVFLYLPLRFKADPAINYIVQYFQADLTTWRGFWWMITGEMFGPEFFGYDLNSIWGEVVSFARLLWSDFLGVGVLLGLCGVIYGLRKRREQAWMLLAAFLVPVFFFVNYRVGDKGTMFLVPELVWCPWMGWGLEWLLSQERRPTRERAAESRAATGIPLWLSLGSVFLVILALVLNYGALDESDTWVVRDFSREVLDSLPHQAMILAEWSSAAPMEYVQFVEQRRPDVQVVNLSFFSLGQRDALLRNRSDQDIDELLQQALLDLVDSNIHSRPVYAFGRDLAWLDDYEFRQQGKIFRLYPLDKCDFPGKSGCIWLGRRP